MRIAARAIAHALGGKRAQRLADGSYLIPCPVSGHGKGRGDRSPSLRIGDGVSRVLVHCFAGCDSRDVLDALRRRGLLDEQWARTAAPLRKPQSPPLDDRARLERATAIWRETLPIIGTPGAEYLDRRGIDLDKVPEHGGLRWHPRCPWEQGTAPCIVTRFTDAVTG